MASTKHSVIKWHHDTEVRGISVKHAALGFHSYYDCYVVIEPMVSLHAGRVFGSRPNTISDTRTLSQQLKETSCLRPR